MRILKKTRFLLAPLAVLIMAIGFFVLCNTLLSNQVSAAQCGGVETSIIQCTEGGTGAITHILRLILDILSIGIGIVGVIGISIAGTQYLSAGGNEEKTIKAKRRIYEMIIGVFCYVILYGAMSWLLPAGTSDTVNDMSTDAANSSTNEPSQSNNPKSGISISYSGKTTTEASFRPVVKFSDNAKDKTYSLVSSNSNLARTMGGSVKCIAEGKTKITAIAADGSKASMKINCKETCYADDSSPSTDTTRSYAGAKTAPDGSIAASDGSATVGSQLKTKFGNKYPRMRKETRKIIAARDMDFFWNNYQRVLKKKYDGSYNKYIQSLTNPDGSDSVFSAYGKRVNKNNNIKIMRVRTAADFQAASEYVWGLMAIWGIDYSNGNVKHHPYWGETADYGQTHLSKDKTAFHYGDPDRPWQVRYWDHGTINQMLKGPEILGTGCNMTINTLYRSTTLPGIGGSGSNLTSQSQKYYHKNGGVIDKATELRVGDVLHMIGENGVHVAVVGEIYKDYVIVYDGGCRFQYTKNYKFKIPRRANNSLSGTEYSTYWYFNGYRVWDIDQSVTLKGLN